MVIPVDAATAMPRIRHSSAAVDAAMGRAIDFLLAARGPDGWWRDFDTLAGSSDEWVSAYVAYALACSELARAVTGARETWYRLRFRSWWCAGWGFNHRVPRDADSTLWVIQLARRLGAERSFRIRRARRWLARHVRPDGGVATYAAALPIRLYTRLGPHMSFRGWCSSHTCVSALAACADLPFGARILEFVRRGQSVDGSWPSYWWCDVEYSTSLAVTALAGSTDPFDQPRVERAISWTLSRVREAAPESAFCTALCLQILASADESAESERRTCLDQLLGSQNRDGSWPASARLRIPPPDVLYPDSITRWSFGARGAGAIMTDQERHFTTATVLMALAAQTARTDL